MPDIEEEIAEAIKDNVHLSPWDTERDRMVSAIVTALAPLLNRVRAEAEEAAATLAARSAAFWSRVRIGEAGECWPWSMTGTGFGHGRWDGPFGNTTAHRYAWAMSHGRMPDPDMVVRHRCDNPPCCNPAHLELGTQKDNVRDMIDRGRALYSDAKCRNGHDRTPENISMHADGTLRCLTCDREADKARRALMKKLPCPMCDYEGYDYNLKRHMGKAHGVKVTVVELRDEAPERQVKWSRNRIEQNSEGNET